MAELQKSENDIKTPINQPIIMKGDESDEDKAKQENDVNEKTANNIQASDEFKVCSPSTRITPTTTTNPFASAPQTKSRGILKPPQLSFNNANSCKPPFVLNPSRLNPFGKGASDSESKNNQINGDAPKFVPLIQSGSQTSSSSSSSAASSIPTTTSSSSSTSTTPSAVAAAVAPNSSTSTTTFVFGQNLQERVVAGEKPSDEPKPSTSLNSNGTTEMLFSSAVKNDVKIDNKKETKSLSESAREYEESRANKRKYEEVEVITGEEEETNILSITCKLFAFDKSSGSWQERGRGNLRLNDLDVDDNYTQSRLVFRTTGSLRVVLNTKIWAEMTVEQASEKSVRFTALDANGEIRVFLIMANIEDSKQIYSQLQLRVQKEIAAQKHKKRGGTDSGGN